MESVQHQLRDLVALTDLRERVRFAQARVRQGLGTALLDAARKQMREDPTEAAQLALCARVAVTRESSDERVEALSLLGQAQTLRGKFAAAVRAYERAIERAVAQRDKTRLRALSLHARIHLGRDDEVRAIGADCLTALAKDPDPRLIVLTRMSLADQAFRLDNPQRALEHYAALASIAAQASPQLRAVIACNRANALAASYLFEEAAASFAEARALLSDDRFRHTRAQVQSNTAYLELSQGQYDAALRRYDDASASFEELGDARHLALIDLERAEVHLRLNMPADATRLAAAASARFRHLGMKKEHAQIEFVRGQALQALGEGRQASETFQLAQELFLALSMYGRVAACMLQRAFLALKQGDADSATEQVEQASILVENSDDVLLAARVELMRARLAVERGLDSDATVALHAASNAIEGIHAPWLSMEIDRWFGKTRRARGDTRGAVEAFRRAIDTLESYRGGVPSDEYMASFLSARADLYTDCVELLVSLGEIEAAYELTERGKSRALVDLLDGKVGRPDEQARDMLGRVNRLRGDLHAVYKRLFDHDSGREQRSARAVREARSMAVQIEGEIHTLLRDARRVDAEAVSLQDVVGLSVADVQATLDPGVALIEYVTTERALVAFLLTRDDLHVVVSDVAEATLRMNLDRFRFHLAKFDRDTKDSGDLVLAATRANLAQLSELVMEPMSELLDGVDRLVVVPHGVLHGAPFHALPLGEDGWLSDRFEITYAPSAAVYRFCRERGEATTTGAAVFGLPDELAPLIEQEARAVAAHLGTENLHLREDATLEAFSRNCKDARFIHIATHGMFRPERPMLSAIRFADRWLNLYDFYDFTLDAELVVLSTCESGIAGVTASDEVFGLTRGLLYAGARAMVTSQWRVNDAATTTFMDCFYGALSAGTSPAAAMQQAMRTVRETKPHPYYWAPFFLTGWTQMTHSGRGRRTRTSSTLVATGT